MTTGGIHLLSGLFFASLIRNENYRKAKWGLVWGSIIPDLDILGSVIGFIITGDMTLSGEVIHRSVSHGFFAMGLIVIIGLIISRSRTDLKWMFQFSVAFALGMLSHTFYDLLDGYVAVLAPFTFERFSLTGASLEHFFGPLGYTLWTGFDAASDSIFYLLLWYWAMYIGDNVEEQGFAKVLLVLAIISIGYFGSMVIIALFGVDPDLIFLLIYAMWGTVYVLVSTLITPYKMRETIQDFSFFELKK